MPLSLLRLARAAALPAPLPNEERHSRHADHQKDHHRYCDDQYLSLVRVVHLSSREFSKRSRRRLLLRQAMDRADGPDERLGVDGHDAPIRKQTLQGLNGARIGRGTAYWREHA